MHEDIDFKNYKLPPKCIVHLNKDAPPGTIKPKHSDLSVIEVSEDIYNQIKNKMNEPRGFEPKIEYK